VRVVPQELSTLAGACLTSSQQLTDAWTGAVGDLEVPGAAAGDTAGGPALVAAHQSVAEAANGALSGLASVLEQDMDDLYAVAFDMTTTDEDAAAALTTLTPGLPSPSPGPAPTPPPTSAHG
jgi:hypothetical protein